MNKELFIQIKQTIQEFDKQFLNDLTQDIVKETKRLAHPHTKSGAMYASIDSEVAYPKATISVGNNQAYYTLYVHFGTKPHIIRPKKKKLLRFEKNGRWISKKIVYHPGYKGDPFLFNAVRNVLNKIK